MFDEISVRYYHSRSKQRTDQRVLVLSLKFLALIKTGFSPCKKYSPFFFYFCLPLLYATFQFGPYNIFKKKLNWFFTPENLKKRASKVAHTLFSQSSPAHSPKLTFHIINMSQDTSVFLSVVMTIPVVEFSSEGNNIRKVFGYKSTVVKWNYQILIIVVMASCQKLDIILENIMI